MEKHVNDHDSAAADRKCYPRRDHAHSVKHPLRLRFITAGAFVVGATLAVYLLRFDQVVGQFKDDGWYVVLAKSLATGHGFNLVNLPQGSGQYFYPPFFPFVLSVLFRLSPESSTNLLLLKSVSIASMFLLSVIVFRLFDRPNRLSRSLAYLVAFSTALAPSFVFLATSTVMSECVFATLQCAALLFAQPWTKGECPVTKGRSAVVMAGLLASAAYLTRTLGIALVAGITLELLRRKLLKEVGIFVATVALIAGSWGLYKHFRIDGANSNHVVAGYSAQFWDSYAGSGKKVTYRQLPGRVWQLSTVMIGDDIGALLLPSFYRSGSESGEELLGMTANVPKISPDFMHFGLRSMGLGTAGQLISLSISIPILIGFIVSLKRNLGSMEFTFGLSILIIVAWPWSPMRFLVPLLPFLLYYLTLGVTQVCQSLRKIFSARPMSDPWRPSRIVLVCILSFFLYDNALYLVARHTDPTSPLHPDWLRQFNAGRQAAEWVRDHTPENEVIAGDNLPFIYLYSSRRTEMCRYRECENKGVRYYVVTGEGEGTPPGNTIFQTTYAGAGVVDIQKNERKATNIQVLN